METFGRRALLAGTGGSAVLLGSGALSSCATKSGEVQNRPEANAAAVLPSYLPYTGITPDLPPNEQGVEAGFHHFPAERPSVAPEHPGHGETISAMGNIFYAVPPGPDQNSYWAGLNERLGVTLDLRMVASGDYTAKFATTIAGNELPDVMQMRDVANFPQLLDKRFTRLDDQLAGDAIKDYPNLANIPTRHWKPTVFNGGLYGIPIPRGAISSYVFLRLDRFEAAGADPEPKGFEELKKVAQALTDPKRRHWAFGGWTQLLELLIGINEAPNVWRESGGKLTHQFETEEYRQAVGDLIELWRLGVIHPDTFTGQVQKSENFNAATFAIGSHGGYLAWTQHVLDNVDTPGFKMGLMPMYTRDGSRPAAWHIGDGCYSITSLKKQESPDKIKLILRVLDWLAAPFGTEEYLYRLFGAEGVDHTMTADGDPLLTKTGIANTVLPIRYMSDSPAVIYQAGRPEDTDVQHAYQSRSLANTMANPVVGLFSNTAVTKSAGAERTFTDGLQQIVRGRRPIADLDALVAAWRQTAGDAMRAEYEDQLQHR
ncbi:extracellular solute-binding protein [Microlunatus speluncae]|uniref:extracellular solute-binding protein n=1 Tax=Microlunatus speluncae TaxID=2594267 RepID=UPI001FEB76BD|nr:extracellular solute-binding protein [Microlunatus speluncae]